MTFIRRKLGDLTAAFLCQVPYQRFCDPKSLEIEFFLFVRDPT